MRLRPPSRPSYYAAPHAPARSRHPAHPGGSRPPRHRRAGAGPLRVAGGERAQLGLVGRPRPRRDGLGREPAPRPGHAGGPGDHAPGRHDRARGPDRRHRGSPAAVAPAVRRGAGRGHGGRLGVDGGAQAGLRPGAAGRGAPAGQTGPLLLLPLGALLQHHRFHRHARLLRAVLKGAPGRQGPRRRHGGAPHRRRGRLAGLPGLPLDDRRPGGVEHRPGLARSDRPGRPDRPGAGGRPTPPGFRPSPSQP